VSSTGLSRTRLDRMHHVLSGYVERDEVPGIVSLVAHVDAIGPGGSVERDTIFRISSMTKPITAAAAMVLAEECKLRLDEPIDRLLPELGGARVLKRLDGNLEDTVPANRPITVRDLLTFSYGHGANHGPTGLISHPKGNLRESPHRLWTPTAACAPWPGRVDQKTWDAAFDLPTWREVDVQHLSRGTRRVDR
jgi:hypothetical protein